MLKKFNTLDKTNLGRGRKGLGYYLETMNINPNLRFLPYIQNSKYGFFVDDLNAKTRENFDLECPNLSELLKHIADLEFNW